MKVLPSITIVAVIIAGGVYLIFQNQFPSREPQFVTEETADRSASEWVSYEKKDIGVAFEYPSRWGNIAVITEGCDAVNVNRGDDPCLQLRLAAVTEEKQHTFLVSESKLYSKYPVARGAFWGDYAVEVNDSEFIDSLCKGALGGTCSVFVNTQGIRFTHFSDDSNKEVGNELEEFYLAPSPHPFYSGIAVSPSRLPLTHKADFEIFLNSLKFISQ